MRLHGQAVKTPPFHGGNRGSNPLGVIKQQKNKPYLPVYRCNTLAEQLRIQLVIGSSPGNIVLRYIGPLAQLVRATGS